MVDYSWVPWFTELARKIAEGGKAELVKKAKQVTWFHSSDDPPILRYGDDNVDPFSFIYSLTSHLGDESFMERLHSAGTAYAVQAALPPKDPCIPRANPMNTLFNDTGKQKPDKLWNLFVEAVEDEPEIDGGLFNHVLGINYVGVAKLTQTLFVINATHFLPADTSNKVLPRSEFQKQLEDYEEYAARVDGIKALFPDCKPYEINTFLDMQGRQAAAAAQGPLITNKVNYFQVSTRFDGDGSEDYWPEFVNGNAIRTGYKGPPDRPYPVSDLKRGDIVLVRYGVTNGRGIGVVEANGYSDGWSDNSRISVIWINKRGAPLQGQTDRRAFGYAGKETRSYKAFKQTEGYSKTLRLIDELSRNGTDGKPGPDHEATAMVPLNQVLYGPPGTGKTFDAVSEAVRVIDGNLPDGRESTKARFDDLREEERVEFVTFHQNYAYEDFIEGIRPVLDDTKKLRYELRDGIFKQIAQRASEDPGNRYVLVVDEINRGNVAKIFGELITLVEPSKRIGREDEAQATLPYSQESFGVPDNLYLIGTMNTADRGIALLDVALRRRFEFVERMPDAELVEEDIEGVRGRDLLRAINERIVENLDRDHQIGHTYFLGIRTLEGLKRAFQTQVVPLLQEYFYDDWEKMRRVLNDNAFITKRGTERPVFDVLRQDDARWLQAESYQAIYGSNSGAADE